MIGVADDPSGKAGSFPANLLLLAPDCELDHALSAFTRRALRRSRDRGAGCSILLRRPALRQERDKIEFALAVPKLYLSRESICVHWREN